MTAARPAPGVPVRDDAPDGVGYEAVLRLPGRPVWLGAVGIVMAICLYYLALALVPSVVLGLGWALSGRQQPFAAFQASALRLETPLGMVATNLAIASLIPICLLIVAVVHRVRPVWLTSVRPGLRWRYTVICAVVALVVFAGFLIASTAADGEPLALHPQPQVVGFLIVVALTTPLQSAAEEVFFRGYLMQALGSLGRDGVGGLTGLLSNRWFAVVASAFLFACFHGLAQQNLPLFVDRFAFGLVAGALVVKTGGLEAPIAAHVLNNVMAWLLAALTTSIAQVRAVQEIGWIDAAFDVGGFVVFALLAWGIGRALQVHVVSRRASPTPALRFE